MMLLDFRFFTLKASGSFVCCIDELNAGPVGDDDEAASGAGSKEAILLSIACLAMEMMLSPSISNQVDSIMFQS